MSILLITVGIANFSTGGIKDSKPPKGGAEGQREAAAKAAVLSQVKLPPGAGF